MRELEPDPTAMALATATRDGRPSVRTVLLKGVDDRGFVFYTNYNSRKARELAATGRASLLFYWRSLERQVRIDGPRREGQRGRVRRLLRDPPAREPLERLRLAPERGHREPRGARVAIHHRASDVRRAGAAARMVGRLPRRPRRVRVLAGPSEPAARSPALRESEPDGLDAGTTRTVTG